MSDTNLPTVPIEQLESTADLDAIRGDDAVPHHVETDTVPEEIVEALASLPDLAALGITNGSGGVLLRRLTETCDWKVPVTDIDEGDDIPSAICTHVEETVGIDVELDGLLGVWEIRVQTEDGVHRAARSFIVFTGTSHLADLEAATVDDAGVEAAAWFDHLPDDAEVVPGTDRLFA